MSGEYCCVVQLFKRTILNDERLSCSSPNDAAPSHGMAIRKACPLLVIALDRVVLNEQGTGSRIRNESIDDSENTPLFQVLPFGTSNGLHIVV